MFCVTNGQQFSGAMQVHNGAMDGIRSRIAHRGPSLEFIVPIFDPRFFRGQELVVVDWLSRLPYALRSAKIGDSTIGGNARATKDQEVPCLAEECPLDRPSVSFQTTALRIHANLEPIDVPANGGAASYGTRSIRYSG